MDNSLEGHKKGCKRGFLNSDTQTSLSPHLSSVDIPWFCLIHEIRLIIKVEGGRTSLKLQENLTIFSVWKWKCLCHILHCVCTWEVFCVWSTWISQANMWKYLFCLLLFSLPFINFVNKKNVEDTWYVKDKRRKKLIKSPRKIRKYPIVDLIKNKYHL